jgi:hypothetical protein
LSVRIIRLGISCRRSVTPFAFNWLLPIQRFSAPSYANQHNTTSVNGFNARRAGAARGLLHCACRTSTVSSCAFHEQWRSALHFLSSFYPLVEGGGWLWCSSLRVSEKSLNCHSSRGTAGLFFTARIEGPPFHRGASASKKNGPAAPLPIFLRPRVARARRATGYPLQFLPHILPLLCHLRFAWRIALGRFGHHHGVKAPLQKGFGKGLRAPHS